MQFLYFPRVQASRVMYSAWCPYIRECGSTLYVGLARAVPPTNINFRLTFLLTRLQEALYEDLSVYSVKFEVYHHFSGLSFIVEVNFWRPPSCDLFILTRKMVPITGRASSFLVFLEFSKTKKRQTNQFTQGNNIIHRLQLHHLTLTFIIHK